MLWLLISQLFFVVNNILWKTFLSVSLTFKLVFVRAIFTSICFVLLYFFMDGNFYEEILQPDYYLIIIGCIFGAGGLYCLIEFLKQGALNYMGYYSFFGIAITGVYTLFFKGDKLNNTYYIVGLIFIILGYILFLKSAQQNTTHQKAKYKDHVLLVSMTICFNTAMIIQSKVVTSFSFVTVGLSQELIIVIFAGMLSLIFKNPSTKEQRIIYSWRPIVMAIVIVAAIVTGLIGLKATNPLSSSLFGLLVPILTVFGAVVLFKEKVSLQHYVALIIMIVGAVGMMM
ncbi:MAG: DMT family transporter [Chitinophagaceae bacterium]|nr:DMT family transporter [Chitinophagaceae bacterium]